MSDSKRIDNLFPTWFKKVQVTFSGQLPLTEDERQQLFVVPYALFEKAIEALIQSERIAAERSAQLDILKSVRKEHQAEGLKRYMHEIVEERLASLREAEGTE